mmetsp:Transcript_4086/g.11732  ORF Transcript_4086/g.11732 Transcript_4086/m.11732 type:complete len:85 (-) Transcript_4086:158-412(-)
MVWINPNQSKAKQPNQTKRNQTENPFDIDFLSFPPTNQPLPQANMQQTTNKKKCEENPQNVQPTKHTSYRGTIASLLFMIILFT